MSAGQVGARPARGAPHARDARPIEGAGHGPRPSTGPGAAAGTALLQAAPDAGVVIVRAGLVLAALALVLLGVSGTLRVRGDLTDAGIGAGIASVRTTVTGSRAGARIVINVRNGTASPVDATLAVTGGDTPVRRAVTLGAGAERDVVVSVLLACGDRLVMTLTAAGVPDRTLERTIACGAQGDVP